jgi:hypothetical protein
MMTLAVLVLVFPACTLFHIKRTIQGIAFYNTKTEAAGEFTNVQAGGSGTRETDWYRNARLAGEGGRGGGEGGGGSKIPYGPVFDHRYATRTPTKNGKLPSRVSSRHKRPGREGNEGE